MAICELFDYIDAAWARLNALNGGRTSDLLN